MPATHRKPLPTPVKLKGQDLSEDRPPHRRLHPRRRRAALLLAIVAAIPFAIHFLDWATAVRTANSNASGAAFHLAGVRFLGGEWRPGSIDPRIVAATIRHPPESGPYAGYAHAVHAEIVVQWRPLFAPIVGGPYRVSGRATAAVLRNRDGEWEPVLVE